MSMILVPTFNVYSDWKAQVGNHDLVYYKLFNPDPAELTPVVLYATSGTTATVMNRFFDKANPMVLPPTFLTDFPHAIQCFTLVFAV
jgi:hypothetical protein